MTEKELRELKKKCDDAEHFMNYWDGNVESLLEATRWIDDYENSELSFADIQGSKEDSDMSSDISFAVYKLSKKAAERAEHWRGIYNSLVCEVKDAEDELSQEYDEVPDYDEPDYGISRGEALWPADDFDFAALGMGV